MSAEGIVQAKRLVGFLDNDSQKTVYLWCGLICNADGLFWPSLIDLSIELGKSERALRRNFMELERYSLIVRKPGWRNDGSQRSNYYQMFLNVSPRDFMKHRRGDGSRIMSTRKRVERYLDAYCDRLESWGQALSLLKEQINHQVFQTWFVPLTVRCLKRNTITLAVPNENFKRYHEEKSRKVIIDAVNKTFSKRITNVYFRTKDDGES